MESASGCEVPKCQNDGNRKQPCSESRSQCRLCGQARNRAASKSTDAMTRRLEDDTAATDDVCLGWCKLRTKAKSSRSGRDAPIAAFGNPALLLRVTVFLYRKHLQIVRLINLSGALLSAQVGPTNRARSSTLRMAPTIPTTCPAASAKVWVRTMLDPRRSQGVSALATEIWLDVPCNAC